MRGKLLLVTGVAVGYVLGSRAGRKRYDQIAKASSSIWHSRPVQTQVDRIGDFAKDNAPMVVDLVGGAAKKLVGGSTAEKKTPVRRKPAAKRPPGAPASPSE
ncbi:MAG: hypothetical protein RI885_270 [Actinomycetota bacterium]|jgi:hypothetical protein